MSTFAEDLHPRVADGRFTDKEQTAPETDLTDAEEFRAVKGYRNGHHSIQSAQTHPAQTGSLITITIGGDPHVNQRYGAALRLISEEERNWARLHVNEFAAAGEKVTVLIERGSQVEALEGTGTVIDGRPALFAKGSKRRYYPIENLNIIGVAKGYGGQDYLAEQFGEKAAIVPVTEKFSTDGIPEYDGSGEQDSIAAAFLIEGPDFGNGSEPGCMFLATDIQTEHGIVNGYFWTPDDAGMLTSESGSFYVRDMERKAGRIRDYEAGSLSYRDAWSKLSEDRATGYREVLGK